MHRDERVFSDANSAMAVENRERSDVDLVRDLNLSAPGLESDMIVESGAGSDFNAGCARKGSIGFNKDALTNRNRFSKCETGDCGTKGGLPQAGGPPSTPWGSRQFL